MKTEEMRNDLQVRELRAVEEQARPATRKLPPHSATLLRTWFEYWREYYNEGQGDTGEQVTTSEIYDGVSTTLHSIRVNWEKSEAFPH